MPYVERVTRAGKTIEVERYFTSRYKKPGIKRGDKVKPTKEEQKKVNTRAAERKLRLLLNANFGYGDYHLELDYMQEISDLDEEEVDGKEVYKTMLSLMAEILSNNKNGERITAEYLESEEYDIEEIVAYINDYGDFVNSIKNNPN